MATTRNTISSSAWTSLGNGPMAVGMDRGSIHFDLGDDAPLTARSGYFHSAQGAVRLVNFGSAANVWARATDVDLPVTVITGQLAQVVTPVSREAYNTYAELPDPTSVQTGTLAVVLADPIDGLNGAHVAIGAEAGQNATYWTAA